MKKNRKSKTALKFRDLKPGKCYVVCENGNDTFVQGAMIRVHSDGKTISTSEAGRIGGCPQPGWILMSELRPENYKGVTFSEI